MHCWGQRSCKGQLGSTRGHIPQKCPVATKFGRKDPRPECNALMRSMVLQVSWGQLEVKLLRNATWLQGLIRGQPEGNCLEMHRAIKCSQCCRALCSCRCSSSILNYVNAILKAGSSPKLSECTPSASSSLKQRLDWNINCNSHMCIYWGRVITEESIQVIGFIW